MFLEEESSSSLQSNNTCQTANEKNLKFTKLRNSYKSRKKKQSHTLPMASNPLSNNNKIPRIRNDIPKPASPTPISETSQKKIPIKDL